MQQNPVALDHVRIFYYRADHQTIQTYMMEVYTHLSCLFPDPSPELHSKAYQWGITLAHSHLLSYMPEIRPALGSVIPILDIGHTIQNLSLEDAHLIDNPELEDLAWEDPINEMLIYEPFLLTPATRTCGHKYHHPMIGDLEDLFHNGTSEIRLGHRPWWGPNWLTMSPSLVCPKSYSFQIFQNLTAPRGASTW